MFDAKARQELAKYFKAHNVPFDPDFSLEKYGMKPMTLDEYRDDIQSRLEQTLNLQRPVTNQARLSVWKRLAVRFSLDGHR